MRKMKRIISLWLAVILVITGVDLPFGILEIHAAANVKRYTVLVLDTSDTGGDEKKILGCKTSLLGICSWKKSSC